MYTYFSFTTCRQYIVKLFNFHRVCKHVWQRHSLRPGYLGINVMQQSCCQSTKNQGLWEKFEGEGVYEVIVVTDLLHMFTSKPGFLVLAGVSDVWSPMTENMHHCLWDWNWVRQYPFYHCSYPQWPEFRFSMSHTVAHCRNVRALGRVSYID